MTWSVSYKVTHKGTAVISAPTSELAVEDLYEAFDAGDLEDCPSGTIEVLDVVFEDIT